MEFKSKPQRWAQEPKAKVDQALPQLSGHVHQILARSRNLRIKGAYGPLRKRQLLQKS